jgi:hypothetical protein
LSFSYRSSAYDADTPIRRHADTFHSGPLTRGLTRDTVAEWECHLQVSL